MKDDKDDRAARFVWSPSDIIITPPPPPKEQPESDDPEAVEGADANHEG